MHHKLYSNL